MDTPEEKEEAAKLRHTTATELLKGMLANPSNTPRAVARDAEAAGMPPEVYLADRAVKQADALCTMLSATEVADLNAIASLASPALVIETAGPDTAGPGETSPQPVE